jgi:hypothetical protein
MSHPLAFASIALDHLSLVTGGSGSPVPSGQDTNRLPWGLPPSAPLIGTQIGTPAGALSSVRGIPGKIDNPAAELPRLS